jgi:ATP-binding cassette, subfamily B, bacterial PglK
VSDLPRPSIVRQALGLLGRERRARWILLVAAALIASVFEIVGAALVFALLGLVAGDSGATDLPLLGEVRAIVGLPDDTFLLVLVGVMAAFFVLRSSVHIGKVYLQNRVVQNAAGRLSVALVLGYLSLPYSSHLRRNSSDLIRNAQQAVDEIASRIYMPIIVVSAESLLILGMLGLLLFLAPGPTLLACTVIGVAAGVLLYGVQPRLKGWGRRAHEMRRETLQVLVQAFEGVRDVKLLGRERAFSSAYSASRMALARTNYLATTVFALPAVVMELALLFVILSVFGLSVMRGVGTEDALPVLGLFAYAGLRLQPSLQKLIGGVNDLKYASAALADIHDDLELIGAEPRRDGVKHRLPFEEAIEFADVSFAYEGAEVPAVRDVSLKIRPGEIVGICGATGGGKSTLTDLITGLLTPSEGRIFVDDVDIASETEAWQAGLGVVSQSVFLTDQTLRENIALGVPSGKIDDDAVEEAIRYAQLESFVESLPHGVATRVGERGVRLSGGQRQRIAIARALYREPSVIIMDEGTSALDNATERSLIDALQSLRGKVTVVLVAHRLSTVRAADRIYFMDDGRLSGVGTYDELLSSHRGFRQLATATGG